MNVLEYQPLNLYSNYELSAKNYPNTPIIFDAVLRSFPELGTETTYQESLDIIKKRAYQLASLGVKKDDKIIIFKSPKFDTYLLAVAASYLGAIPVMISYHFPKETMEVFVERLENPFILFDEETKAVVESISNSASDRKIAVDYLLEQPATPVEPSCLALDQISYMTHTSGTTGIPKLICHSANSMGWRTLWQRTIFTRIQEKRLVAFHISPVHSRFNIGVSSLMAMGFPMMPISSSDSQIVADMVEKHQPIAMETHPNNFVQWTFTAKERPEAFASLKYFHSTFDAINNGTMKTFLTAAKNNDPIFLQVYGQSECGPMILKAHTLETIDSNNARNMGVGLEGLTRARITDPEGNELPANTDGHIHFLSKGRALTYYKEDDRFQSTVHGEWWDSGDWGMIDDDGQLYLKDRQVDLIKNINSNLALEDLLLDNLDFLAEVVIVRDKDNLPQPIIALGPDEEMDWDSWWKQIEDLPHLNHPIIKPFDEIPRTATMKVQRLQIEKAFKNQ
ncbi:class I adenylate-forming enzyme family protein [Vagococcus xieshaowenii]|uniref:Acyl-CoA synthetase n=1 Tax=Vagococcus xieshaowenii TaxID=2562451 RepID=A0AAJ5EGK4_9ENTE|nr:acyl-CoA synthetase [Vagococcus xieshaowenii]QCA28214.1 acyl-CoA synthetase [Vagococcus xieshaowenii]TFZ42566.1 acyl-CoA synthetase [Vagococcus xieshaowenii]